MLFDIFPASDVNRISRWYFGGIAATMAQVLVHPIDVVKVGIQTAQVMENITAYRYFKYLLNTQGFIGIYSGLFSSMKQQFAHSTTRFGIYLKTSELMRGQEIPMYVNMLLLSVSGACGAIVRNPIEIVNVRMQTDYKLSPPKRYNYKSVTHAMRLISMTDGYRALFLGVQLNIMRSVAFTGSQIGFYYRFKEYLCHKFDLGDTTGTHVLSSASAGLLATLLCQPIDVLKVRYMSKSDEFSGIWDVVKKQIQIGGFGFYRGTLLTFVKIEIQTIVTMVTMEKLRLHFGIIPRPCVDDYEALLGRCRIVPKPPPPPPPPPPTGILFKIKHYVLQILKVRHYIPNVVLLFRRRKPPEVVEEEEEEPEVVAKLRAQEAAERLVKRLRMLRKLFVRIQLYMTEYEVVEDLVEDEEEEEVEEDEEVKEVPEKQRQVHYPLKIVDEDMEGKGEELDVKEKTVEKG